MQKKSRFIWLRGVLLVRDTCEGGDGSEKSAMLGIVRCRSVIYVGDEAICEGRADPAGVFPSLAPITVAEKRQAVDSKEAVKRQKAESRNTSEGLCHLDDTSATPFAGAAEEGDTRGAQEPFSGLQKHGDGDDAVQYQDGRASLKHPRMVRPTVPATKTSKNSPARGTTGRRRTGMRWLNRRTSREARQGHHGWPRRAR